MLWTWLFILSYVFALPDQSQSCISNINIPFTGYKVEYQLNVKYWQGTYHLLYCNDNKLIYNLNLNETIPWTSPVVFHKSSLGEGDFILARRKTFALRSFPIFLPNTLVGSLYYGDSLTKIQLYNNTESQFKSVPLIAANILRNWCEVSYKLDIIYHVPVLTTPGIDSKYYNFGFFDSSQKQNDWDKYILMSENYDYKHDPRILLRKSMDGLLSQVDKFINGHRVLKTRIYRTKTAQNATKIWWKLIILSKVVSEEIFNKLVVKLDKLLQ
ncbi:hypothetical protein CANMA_004604 [Candida margitis]|uniref:uncharacterized protein n=1 Tax=Candida margitis TaxID=1775924 RepID=UPI0022275225|nr:uncharacterized protein CANMA_004604 [Candida margitis]KAI5955424.1 hypothetical protein CANMA_004604 [Candida margitis]